MSIRKIKKFNPQNFLDDLKKVRDVMVLPDHSSVYLRTTKKDVMKAAQYAEIMYYISDEVFLNKRQVMVIF